jgi:uncharacterized RDD family membrane protein YckC
MTSTTAAAPQSETSRAPGLDDRAQYVGLATRAVAFVIDSVLIALVAVVVGAVVALIASVFHFPKELDTILKWIGLGAYVLWLIGYFVAFWSATGQTPGNRVMQIRVVTKAGERVKTRRGVVRCVGLVLAALPLFAGYLLILFDRKRRGFQDRLARTVVIEAPDLSLAQAQRLRQRQAAEAARGSRASAAEG